ncbi:ankyrin repeat domain-containing protein [Vibrio sp. WXL103]|uniref:ankyrin repeat domain-containing protein n=1 Tax=unclassified Vibrio TaxID=2614977 RepID=UPI003EC55E2D
MTIPTLHQTIIDDAFKAFLLALDEGADCNQLDPIMGNSPLHIAAQQSSAKWVRRLLEAGALVNLQTPKHGVTPLMIAVWHRNPEVVKILLLEPDINIEIISTFGLKAEQLIDFGASEDDAFGAQQSTEMAGYFARYKQKLSALNQQLSAYSIVTDTKLSDSEKAQKLRSLSDLSTLNTTTAVTCSGNDEHTAVMVAARDGLAETLKALMDLGGDQTIPDHYMKAIPLHKAAYNGHAECIRVLSHYPGFAETLNAQGPNNGYTPLHDAIWHGHLEAASVLIKAGANTELKGFDGKTPIELAREFHYQAIVDLLA